MVRVSDIEGVRQAMTKDVFQLACGSVSCCTLGKRAESKGIKLYCNVLLSRDINVVQTILSCPT